MKKKNVRREEKSVLENYKWFSKFTPVEKLRIAKRAVRFIQILKGAK